MYKNGDLFDGDVRRGALWVTGVSARFRALRKHLSQAEMRRAARKPHLPVRVKLPLAARVLATPIPPSSASEPIVLED